MAKPFKRSLTKAGLDRLSASPAARALIAHANDQDDLSVFLRGDCLDVYLRGFDVFRIKTSGSLQIGSASEKKPSDFPVRLHDLDITRIAEYADWVRQRRKAKSDGHSPELRFESLVVAHNRGPGSPVQAVDRQVARPGSRDRLDLALLDVGTSRIALAELKANGNTEASGKVLDQLERYRVSFGDPALLRDYSECIDQMKTLGILQNASADLDPEDGFILLIMLAGYPVKKLGASKDSGHFVRLLREKRSRFPATEVKLITFPDTEEESHFDIATSIASLPTIEEWCDLYLS